MLLGSRKVKFLESENEEVGGIDELVLYDKGSDVSLVRSAFVQKQGKKGKPVTGEIEASLSTKGKPVKILAMHELPVRCGVGPMKTITVYEVESIGKETKDLDPRIMVGLFPKGPFDFTVQKGMVDILLGRDKMEFHPTMWDQRAGLILS